MFIMSGDLTKREAERERVCGNEREREREREREPEDVMWEREN